MKALLYKQFMLVCHPMTAVFCLFGAMVLIPAYPYTVAFLYGMLGLFFSFTQGREQRDGDFTALLPVAKRDYVAANALFMVIIELGELLLTVPFAVISVRINPNGFNQVGLQANTALFAVGLIAFGLFNGLFLSSFFRTGYKAGVAFLKAMIPTSIVMIVGEILPHLPELDFMNDLTLNGQASLLPLLGAGLAFYAVSTWVGFRCAANRYERVDL